MNIFNLKKRFFIVLAILILGMVFLQVLHKKTKEDFLTKNSYFLFSEIQTFSVNFRNGVSNLIKKYFFLLNLREKNKELQRQNKELKTQYQIFEELLKENERLKNLIQFLPNKKSDFLPAQIVGTDFLSKNELLTINKGGLQGVKKFMGVLHPKGVVGYIFRVSPNSSQVISLLNPLSSLPARNRRSRTTGLIESHQKGLLLFNYIDKETSRDEDNENLKIGDEIVTMQSDQFPSGFLVGTILSLDYSPKRLNPMVYVKPAVGFYSLEEVLIILNPKNNFLKNTANALRNKKNNNENEN